MDALERLLAAGEEGLDINRIKVRAVAGKKPIRTGPETGTYGRDTKFEILTHKGWVAYPMDLQALMMNAVQRNEDTLYPPPMQGGQRLQDFLTYRTIHRADTTGSCLPMKAWEERGCPK